jgi:hypothetical protein
MTVRVHVFHGPSVTSDEVARILPDARSHPPVRHGDLLALDCRVGDVVLIIDGVFHATAPVRHKEILRLLAEGVSVVGAASMGALRAAELYPYGMQGVGRIFEMYRDGVIDGDDEVAVAHTSDDARPLTVALVDIRGRLDEAVRAGMLTPAEADRLLGLARSIPYPHRNRGALNKAVANDAELPARAFDWWMGGDGAANGRSANGRSANERSANGPFSGSGQLSGSARPGLKHADALAALAVVAEGRVTPPGGTSMWVNDPWFTPQLREWVGRFRPRGPEAGRVPFTAELQHQRLYDPGFPARWQAFVLAWIAGDEREIAGDEGEREGEGDERAGGEQRAVEAAQARGLTLESLSPRQIGHWLTPTETRNLPSTEQFLRLLVRSACLGMAGHPRFTDPESAGRLLDERLDSATAVRTAWQINEVVAKSAPHRSVIRLRPELLVAHLADRWGAPVADGPALDAAARDRGFSDVQSAMEAARAFYLHVSGVLDGSPS